MKDKQKRHKGVVQKLLLVVCFLIGLFIFLYPFISDGLNDYLNQKIVQMYQNQANRKSEKELERIRKEAEKRNEQAKKEQNPGAGQEPFEEEAQSETIVGTPSYLEEHTIGVIVIPKIDVLLPIFDITNEVLLSKGVSLLEGTSYIGGGESTHAVISGHRGLREAKLFTDLPELQEGDTFYIEYIDERYAYEVDQIKVIEPTQVEDLLVSDGEDLVTLMTCTPYSINSHRLLIRGKRIPYVEKMTKEIEKTKQRKEQKFTGLILCAIGIVLIVSFLIVRIIKGKRKKV